MKKFPVLLSLLCSAMMATAQTESPKEDVAAFKWPASKGRWMAGTDVSMGTMAFTGASARILNLNVAPQLGYFVSNKLAVGLFMDGTMVADDRNLGPQYLIGPFVRLYVGKQPSEPSFPKARFFVEAGAGGGMAFSGQRNPFSWEMMNNRQSFEAMAYVKPGVSLFLNRKWSVEAGVQVTKPLFGYEYQLLSLKTGFRVFLGK